MKEDEPGAAFAIRRILVALDSSPHSLAALEAAVDLAGRLEAELAGLFVEDVELLRMADSPLAREILYPSSREASVDRATMERKLRAQSEQARSALATAAQRAQVQWSFRTVRGHVTPAVLAAAGEADLLAIGKLGWSLGTRVRIGSTALELAASRVPLLLLPEHGPFANRPWLVYYDGSSAAKRATRVAAQLADTGKKGMIVLIATSGQESVLKMQHEVDTLLGATHGIQVRYRRIDPQDESALMRALKEEEAGVLVLGSRELLQKLLSVEAVLRESEMPVMLLGN